MVRVGGVTPPYRPCPECGGSGSISEAEQERRAEQRAKKEAKKNKGFGITMIIVGLLLLYGGVTLRTIKLR
jgi:hypothetical protein